MSWNFPMSKINATSSSNNIAVNKNKMNTQKLQKTIQDLLGNRLGNI